jgi:hypothetical protein
LSTGVVGFRAHLLIQKEEGYELAILRRDGKDQVVMGMDSSAAQLRYVAVGHA